MAKKETKAISPFLYDVLKRPVITSKYYEAVENKATFFVDMNATKNVIKQAVEAIYNVNVEKVNIIKNKPSTRKFRGILGKTNKTKKAIVTLVKGQKIDVSAAV